MRVRVHCFSTGVVRGKRAARGIRRYLPSGWRAQTLPINVFLIVHPAGLCLFDAGQTARATIPGYFPWWHPFFRLARFELSASDEASVQVAKLGYDLAAVRWVILSHLHTDHSGGVAEFPSASLVVSEVEWGRAQGLAGRVRGYLPQHWPAGVEPQLADFKDGAVGPFPGSLDLAGDGALLVVPAPGHTPGHVGLLVRAEKGRYLLAGDLVGAASELGRTAPTIGDFCRSAGVTVLATHDPDACDLAAGAEVTGDTVPESA